MKALRVWIRAALRRHVVGIVFLIVLAGLGLGLASVALTGARRADTAYDRLREQSLAPDALIGDVTGLSEAGFATLAADPRVTAIGRFGYTPVAPEPLVPGVTSGAFVGLDDDFLDSVYRPVVIEGRLARTDATDEVVVNEALAEAGDLEVGQRVVLNAGFEDPQPLGEATVVGIIRGIFDVGANTGNPAMFLRSSFLEAYPEAVVPGPPVLMARLAHGADDLDEFSTAATTALGTPVTAFGGDDEAIAVERTLRVQYIALGMLGLIAGVATLAAATQALTRLLDAPLAEVPILVDLGVRPGRGSRLGVLLALPVVALTPLGALVVILVGTPRVPTGFARTVDPSVGSHLDLVVVVGVSITWVVGMVIAGALTGRRAGRAARPELEPVRAITRSLPLVARLGGQAALAPVRARAGAAARSAIVAGVVAVAGIVAVTTYTASLDRLRDDLRLAGWDFDAVLSGFAPSLDEFRAGLAEVGDVEEVPGVTAVSWVSIVGVDVGSGGETLPIEGYAFDPDAGAVHPTLRSGRPPLSDDEVAVGPDVLRGKRARSR